MRLLNDVNGVRKIYANRTGEIRCSKLQDSVIDFNQSTKLSFKYVLSGEESYEVGGLHQCIQAGQSLFFREHQKYSANISRNTLAIGLCFDLELSLIEEASRNHFNDDYQFFIDPEFVTQKISFLDITFQKYLNEVPDRNSIEDELYLDEVLNRVAQAVIDLELSFRDKTLSLPVQNHRHQKELFQRLIVARNFLHDHVCAQTSLDNVAQAAALSPFYLQRLFKKAFGFSPSQYLEKLKMEEAARLLKAASSVTNTAYILSYSDVPYFSRRFKRYFGVTPSQYANNQIAQ